jgi:hypothetical protein
MGLETASKEFLTKFFKARNDMPKLYTDTRGEIPGAKGNRIYNWLALNSLIEKIEPHLNKNGLMFTQPIEFLYNPSDANNGLQIATINTFFFSQTEAVKMSGYPYVVTGDPQSNGSSVSYGRRYSLYGILGIFPQKDDDGRKAWEYEHGVTAAKAANAQKPKNEPNADGISREDAYKLRDLAKQIDGFNLLAYASAKLHRQVTRLSQFSKAEGAEMLTDVNLLIRDVEAQQQGAAS